MTEADGTDPAALTDEELAEVANEVHNAIWIGRDDTVAVEGQEALDRLIAAMRASRAEVERLSGGLYSGKLTP